MLTKTSTRFLIPLFIAFGPIYYRINYVSIISGASLEVFAECMNGLSSFAAVGFCDVIGLLEFVFPS